MRCLIFKALNLLVYKMILWQEKELIKHFIVWLIQQSDRRKSRETSVPLWHWESHRQESSCRWRSSNIETEESSNSILWKHHQGINPRQSLPLKSAHRNHRSWKRWRLWMQEACGRWQWSHENKGIVLELACELPSFPTFLLTSN